ncbi:hypothetical protein SAMN05421773_11812 [Streptomyces aidingensis]|uniref:Uncharacterized protein n=2 Tax=Streptomyces aidingensis TaxID=910347 RepID=A0A1I1T6H2_9ACTN|nr:hypothetical protein SAMN05421773_11812 [Streptomyces aidingensis]
MPALPVLALLLALLGLTGLTPPAALAGGHHGDAHRDGPSLCHPQDDGPGRGAVPAATARAAHGGDMPAAVRPPSVRDPAARCPATAALTRGAPPVRGIRPSLAELQLLRI